MGKQINIIIPYIFSTNPSPSTEAHQGLKQLHQLVPFFLLTSQEVSLESRSSPRVKRQVINTVKALITLTTASYEASCSNSRYLVNLWGGHPPEGAASLESEHLQQAKKDPKSRKPEQPVIYRVTQKKCHIRILSSNLF